MGQAPGAVAQQLGLGDPDRVGVLPRRPRGLASLERRRKPYRTRTLACPRCQAWVTCSIIGDVASALAYVAAAITALWGVAHALPTARVLRGFEPIIPDNRLVILQEWIAEAMTMWGIAALIIAVTAAGAGTSVAHAAYAVAAALLVALAILTALTGARTPVVFFKICPVLQTASAALLVAAILA